MNHESHYRIRTLPVKSKVSLFESLINNKKTRIVGTVLGVYFIVGTGIGYMLITPSQNPANAGIAANDKSIIATVEEDIIEDDSINTILTLHNTSKQEISEFTADFYTSKDLIDWNQAIPLTNGLGEIKISDNSLFELPNIQAGQKVQYSIRGTIKKLDNQTLAIMAHLKYVVQESAKETTTNKIFISLGAEPSPIEKVEIEPNVEILD
jgi:hypothetical protein